MDSRIHCLLDCRGGKFWPLAGTTRYVYLGNLRMSYHTRTASRLPTITSTTPLICSHRCHRAHPKRAAGAFVVFHRAYLLTYDAHVAATGRFMALVVFRARSER